MGQEERPGQRALDLIASALKVTHQLNEAYPQVPYLPAPAPSIQAAILPGGTNSGPSRTGVRWVPRYLSRGVHTHYTGASSIERGALLVRVRV